MLIFGGVLCAISYICLALKVYNNQNKHGPYKQHLLKDSYLTIPRQTAFNQAKKRRLENEQFHS